jgi:hypothetical protein
MALSFSVTDEGVSKALLEKNQHIAECRMTPEHPSPHTAPTNQPQTPAKSHLREHRQIYAAIPK